MVSSLFPFSSYLSLPLFCPSFPFIFSFFSSMFSFSLFSPSTSSSLFLFFYFSFSISNLPLFASIPSISLAFSLPFSYFPYLALPFLLLSSAPFPPSLSPFSSPNFPLSTINSISYFPFSLSLSLLPPFLPSAFSHSPDLPLFTSIPPLFLLPFVLSPSLQSL